MTGRIFYHTARLVRGLFAGVMFALAAALASAEQPAKPVANYQVLRTPDGVRFGLLGAKRDQPAPTLIVLANSIEGTLGSDYFLQCGVQLLPRGWRCVSVDLPAHGQDVRPGEPEGLAGWCHRLEAGEDFIGALSARLKSVVDELISNGTANPQQIAACGTSRGAFAALHFAAGDARVRWVIALAPVTKLAVLDEFRNMRHPERAAALSVDALSDRLANRAVWMVIGDRDRRVSTDETIAFARRLSATIVEKKLPGRVDLLVLAEPKGHTTPAGAAEQAATWLAKQSETKDR